MISSTLWGALATALLATFVPSAQALPNLRIMPLGDSITKGSGSTGIVGYRGPLRQKLLNLGLSQEITVDMVGSLRDGNMADDDHEGHSGKFLAQINEYWKLSIQARPNVILVHAGTNNMDKNVDLDIAVDLMSSIIDGIFESAPDATVLVAPVIWANNPRMQANTDRFNPQVEALIESRQKQGKHILSVHIDITVSDLKDDKHPNDKGYNKMADAWLQSILEADLRGWLKEPVKRTRQDAPGTGIGIHSDQEDSGMSDSQGPKGRVWEKAGRIFEGFRTWEDVGTIRGAVENGHRDKVRLADLNNDGRADYIIADDDGTVQAWINNGGGAWTSLGKINPDWKSMKITGDMVRLADVDNDGRADLIVLYEDGAARVWKNVDNGRKFESLDAKWATGLAPRDKVTIEDVDGDGYADYVVVWDGGAVLWARNTHNNGKDSSKKNWETGVTIATGPRGVPDKRARVMDMDGDGKADYLVVYEGGAVAMWRNALGEGRDNNWEDLGTIAPGVQGVSGPMIRFADMDGDGLSDFLAVNDDGSIRMFKNLGIVGGSASKGESMRFADLTGDGKDDIISVDAQGRARAWINQGLGFWDSIGEIATGFPDQDLSASRIEFADVNGDGKADYLIIYGGGAVKAYLNNGNLPEKPQGQRIWKEGIEISPGVGEPGRKVHFADINGDGYDDFLIIYDGGAVKCWLNNKNIPPKDGKRIWSQGEIIATGVGEPGSKVRFADLTGDGKAEYIVQYLGGAAKAYRNLGRIPGPDKPKWSAMGEVATGVNPQGPVRYADINGDGKADYLVRFGDGSVNAYINVNKWEFIESPPDNGGGDNGGGGNGPLPVEEEDWRTVPCTDVGVINAEDDADFRWKEVHTDAAWRAVVRGWNQNKTDPDYEFPFVRSVSNFFHRQEHMACETLVGANGCTGPRECKDSQDASAPAGYFILNSFVRLESLLLNFYNALGDTQGNIDARMGKFADLFVSKKEPKFDMLIVLDIISIGYASLAAPIWNKVIKNWDFSKKRPDDYDTAKDFTNDLTYQGITLAKDLISLSRDEIEAKNELEYRMALIVKLWKKSISNYAEWIFSGRDEAVKMLGKIIANGKMMSAKIKIASADELETSIEQSLYSTLIPVAWKISPRDLNPFLFDTELSCDEATKDEWIQKRLTDKAKEASFVCDEKNDRGYYLVASEDPKNNCFSRSGQIDAIGCSEFEMLPGTDELGSVWGDITKEDIVMGSLATYKANGNKNVGGSEPWDLKDSKSDWDEMLGNLQDFNLRAPYVFTLPVCTYGNAVRWSVWYSDTPADERPYHFPCGRRIGENPPS